MNQQLKKYYFIALILISNSLCAQVVNSNNSIVWNPYSGDARVNFTFYSKGVMAGSVESVELLVENTSSHKLLIKVSYTVYDICGSAKSYTKAETLEAGKASGSYGAFFSGVDFSTSCKDVNNITDKARTKIQSITVQINSIEDLTAKEDEVKRKEEEQVQLRKQKDAEEKRKKKDEEEKRAAAEAKANKEAAEQKQVAEEDDRRKKEFQEKEAKAKEIADKDERTATIDKMEKEKMEAEKKKSAPISDEEKKQKQQENDDKFKRSSAAQKLEMEGDNLKNTDPSLALEKYQQAQSIYYSSRVEQKIKDLKSSFIAKGAADVVMGVSNLTDNLDPEGKTRYSQCYIGFDGIIGNYEKLYTNYKQAPALFTAFGIRLSALFLALELRTGYSISPIYEYEVVSNEKGEDVILDKVGLQSQNLTFGLSAGLNFAIKNFTIYGLYGVEYGTIPFSQKLYNDQYKLVGDNVKFPGLIWKLSTGIDFRIPKTSVGFGIRYNVNIIKTKPETNFVEIKNLRATDSRYIYYTNKIVEAKYQYSDFGVRFIWGFN